jgi:hypothetical protein
LLFDICISVKHIKIFRMAMISHALKIRSPGRLSLTAVLLAAALATAPAAAFSDDYHHDHGDGWHHDNGGGDYRHDDGGDYHHGGNALGGVLLGLGVGALVGGVIAQQNYAPPPPVYYAPPPAYYAPPPVYYASPSGY